jgi:shikimate kinase
MINSGRSSTSSLPARIFLIGLPGAGKTTLGRALAAELGWPFVDLDEAIAAEAGCSVAALFQAEGEAAFRLREAAVLRRVGVTEPLVLATGGGTPCFHDSLDWLLAHGQVVWLQAPLKTIANRLMASAVQSRPLLAAAENNTPEATLEALFVLLEQTLASRLPFYARAPWQSGFGETAAGLRARLRP